MISIFDAKANEELTVIFALLGADGTTLVSGQAANVGKALRDEDGAATEGVTVEEQGTSGFYEARLTPTKSKATGRVYFLELRSPAATTDGAILNYTIRSFPSIAVSGVTGTFLTTLANVKEVRGITGTSQDALLTSLLARVSTLVENRLGGVLQKSYQEIRDGNGGTAIVLRHRPVISVSAVYVSNDQVWDATTLVASSGYVMELDAGILYRKDGGYWGSEPQSVRVDHSAGYATVPLDVEHYAIKKVLEFFDQRETLGLTTISLKDGSFTRAARTNALLHDLNEELGRYVHRRYS